MRKLSVRRVAGVMLAGLAGGFIFVSCEGRDHASEIVPPGRHLDKSPLRVVIVGA